VVSSRFQQIPVDSSKIQRDFQFPLPFQEKKHFPKTLEIKKNILKAGLNALHQIDLKTKPLLNQLILIETHLKAPYKKQTLSPECRKLLYS